MMVEKNATPSSSTSLVAVFIIFLRLGLTSFGGPIAHLGFFRNEFVERRRWLGDREYADLVALAQFLPGPASSQVGIALGLLKRGIAGAVAAWLGFTLPSAIGLVIFAFALTHAHLDTDGGALHGLKVAAVAVVAQALWGMAVTLCPDRPRATMAIGAAVVSLTFPGVIGQLAAMLSAGVIGVLWLAPKASPPPVPFPLRLSMSTALVFLGAFFVLLVGLPIASHLIDSQTLRVADAFYRSGALVFGGGHVVLPLLRAETVPNGWVSDDLFLAGYGAAQAVPGPLFSFAAYLGAVSSRAPNGLAGAALALVAIYLPSFLLVIGALPLWQAVRSRPALQRAMSGVNAAVVGLLLAAFYNPVWVGAIRSAADVVLAAVGFLLLSIWKAPSWAIVILCATAAVLGWH